MVISSLKDFAVLYNSTEWDAITLQALERFRVNFESLTYHHLIRETSFILFPDSALLLEIWSWISPTWKTLEKFENFEIFQCSSTACAHNSFLFTRYLEQFSQIGEETCVELFDALGNKQQCCFVTTSEIWKVYIAPLLLCMNDGLIYDDGKTVSCVGLIF